MSVYKIRLCSKNLNSVNKFPTDTLFITAFPPEVKRFHVAASSVTMLMKVHMSVYLFQIFLFPFLPEILIWLHIDPVLSYVNTSCLLLISTPKWKKDVFFRMYFPLFRKLADISSRRWCGCYKKQTLLLFVASLPNTSGLPDEYYLQHRQKKNLFHTCNLWTSSIILPYLSLRFDTSGVDFHIIAKRNVWLHVD